MSGTCSVRTENAGASMSISRSNAWRAEILVSGRLISEVGRGKAMSATVFIVERVLLQFLKSLRLTARGARAAARGQVPRGTTNQARCRAFARDRPVGSIRQPMPNGRRPRRRLLVCPLPGAGHARFRTQTGAERGIGQVYRLEPFFGVAAAAVGIRMMALCQFLVAGFDGIEGGGPRQAERCQRLPQFRRRLLTRTAPALVELRAGQDTQRVPQHLIIPCGGAQSAK